MYYFKIMLHWQANRICLYMTVEMYHKLYNTMNCHPALPDRYLFFFYVLIIPNESLLFHIWPHLLWSRSFNHLTSTYLINIYFPFLSSSYLINIYFPFLSSSYLIDIYFPSLSSSYLIDIYFPSLSSSYLIDIYFPSLSSSSPYKLFSISVLIFPDKYSFFFQICCHPIW